MSMGLGVTFDPEVDASAQALRRAWGERRPDVAVILGSGWGSVAQALTDTVDVRYADLPAFPRLDIEGHAGLVRLGRLPAVDASGSTARNARADVMVLMGRQHAYEHGNAAAMRGAVQTIAALGCRTVVLTNAAGAINAAMQPGDLMLINDHLNIAQRSPLVDAAGSERFIDMSQVYDGELRAQAMQALHAASVRVHEGVYAWVLGPQFETPAEIRMLRTLGADAVGMSTVPEAIAARHVGLRVMGVTLVTNMAAGLSAVTLSHAQTLTAAEDHEAPVRQAMLMLLSVLRW